MFYRRSSFVLAGFAVFSAACTRDTSTKPATENTSIAPSISSGAFIGYGIPATSSSTGDALLLNPRNDKPPEKPPLPRWAQTTPQPASPAGLFARGIKGPINEPFEGLLACQITVSGTSWDTVVPFIGTEASGLPDIRVRYAGSEAFLPYDKSSGTVVFPGVTLTKNSQLTMDASDVDPFRDDDIGEVTFDASHGFPLEAQAPNMKMVCRGVPRSALKAEITPREAALERVLVAMEKAPIKVDLDHPEKSRKGIDAAQKAVLELATYAGFDDTTVRSAITRIAIVEANQAARYVEAINAEIAKHPRSEFQSLPSGRVRCHPTKPAMVEVEVGSRALQHEWSPKNLGSLQFRFLSKSGVEFAPTFDALFVDGKKVEDSTAIIPAKTKVDYEYYSAEPEKKPYALVVREGPKRVYLCVY